MNAFNVLISGLDTAKKSANLIDQQKLYKLKCKEEIKSKKPQDIQDLWDTIKQCNICVVRVSEGEWGRTNI